MAVDKAALNKELRNWYRERGICIACGQTWAEPGYVRCKACYALARAREKKNDPDGMKHKQYVKAMRDRRKAAGLCVDCGAPNDGIHVRCAKCIARRNESSQVYKIRQRMMKRDC